MFRIDLLDLTYYQELKRKGRGGGGGNKKKKGN